MISKTPADVAKLLNIILQKCLKKHMSAAWIVSNTDPSLQSETVPLPVCIGCWYSPDLNALENSFSSHHHSELGVPVGIIALALCRAIGSTGTTGCEKPLI